MAYQPIENYGIIGNMRTVALCGMHGSIDWYCVPRFDSPSVFAAILDDQKGGRFQIIPDHKYTEKQFYWPDTNVLVTRFLSADGVAEISDHMPVGDLADTGLLIRQVEALSGDLTFNMLCEPAFNYARDAHTTRISDAGAIFDSPALRLGLATQAPLEQTESGVKSRFTLHEGEIMVFALRPVTVDEGCGVCFSHDEARRLFNDTCDYWRRWLSQCTYTGRWREIVYRSALALKLMTYEPTGAIIAAPTCGLPENIGGERNWDYRYSWLRDAAFTVYAFLRIGFRAEAEAFMNWLTDRCFKFEADGSPLQPLYGIEGETELEETILDHLEGYRGSSPVRIGNAAYAQLQMDIYGELMDAVYLYNKYGSFISYTLWDRLRSILNWLADNWQREDLGIWEVRGEPTVYVYSRMMGWVAFGRAIRIADKRSFPADRQKWERTRDTIYDEIMQHGWHDDLQTFTQKYDDDDGALDAANLLMPLVFFVGAKDPRMQKTINAILQSPDEGGLTVGSMVYRYNLEHSPDGLAGDEGAFNMCTFWLVEALTRAGRINEARLIFERMLSNANHLGLYAEETGKSGEALGNFPQAFTHLSLISAAFNLDRSLNGR